MGRIQKNALGRSYTRTASDRALDQSPRIVTFAHPETGELLETKEQFLAAVAEVEARMVPYWKIRRAIREEYAERFEAPLPRARDRSPTQEKVARCPRCGEKLKKEEAP